MYKMRYMAVLFREEITEQVIVYSGCESSHWINHLTTVNMTSHYTENLAISDNQSGR